MEAPKPLNPSKLNTLKYVHQFSFGLKIIDKFYHSQWNTFKRHVLN